MEQKDQFNEVITELTRGMSFNTACQVEKVLEYYVGTKNSPTPFGGRANKIRELDDWLVNPDEPLNIALIANAGRGKSALLANWIVQLLQNQNNFHIVYFPITSRYSTNLESVVFNALAGRMASLFNENLDAFNPLDAQRAKELFISYLGRIPDDNKKVLIILDGLDEAAGWEVGADLFPANTKDYLIILITARPLANEHGNQEWLSRLGWDRPGYAKLLDLETLNIEGVRDILFKMGNPLAKLSIEYDIYTKLHELSEGDPLLLRLYIESLQGNQKDVAVLNPDDLLKLKPGLEAYFDRWFADQRKIWREQFKAGIINRNDLETDKGIRNFFRILAFAHSPLAIEDIFCIGNSIFSDCDEIRNISRYVYRFIIGNGKESGFVFSHPKLGYYFKDQLSQFEKDAYKQLFADYCDLVFYQVKEKTITPKDVSQYVVKNYCIHLQETHAKQEKFYALMCKEWLKAWEWVDGTPSGFLSDIDFAWKKAKQDGLHGLGKQVFAALCYSSVISLSNKFPIDLLTQAIEKKIVSPQLGYIYIEREKKIKIRIEKIIQISQYFPDYERINILRKALNLSVKINDTYSQVKILIRLAESENKEERGFSLRKALDCVEEIDYKSKQLEILIKLAEKFTGKERKSILDNAINLAVTIHDVDSLIYISKIIPKERVKILNIAIESSKGIGLDDLQIKAMAEKSLLLSEKERKEILAESFNIAKKIDSEKYKIDALIYIIDKMSIKEREDITFYYLEFIRNTPWFETKTKGFGKIFKYLPDEKKGEIIENVERLFYNNINYYKNSLIFDEIVNFSSYLPSEEKIHAKYLALKIIDVNNSDLYRQILMLNDFALYLCEDKEERNDLQKEIIQKIENLTSTKEKVNILTTIAPDLPIEKGNILLKKAIQYASKIDDEENRITLVLDLIRNIPENKKIEIVNNLLNQIDRINNEFERSKAIIRLLSDKSILNRENLLHNLMNKVEMLINEKNRKETLNKFFSNLSEEEKKELLPSAIEITHKIIDENIQLEILISIANHCTNDNAIKIYLEAIENIKKMEGNLDKFKALHKIIKVAPNEIRIIISRFVSALVRDMSKEKDKADIIFNKISSSSLKEEKMNYFIQYRKITSNIERDIEKVIEEIFEIKNYMSENDVRNINNEILNLVYCIPNEYDLILRMTTISKFFSDEERINILKKALKRERHLLNDEQHANVLADIISNLPKEGSENLLSEALDHVSKIKEIYQQIRVFTWTAIYADKKQQYYYLNQALKLSLIEEQDDRVKQDIEEVVKTAIGLEEIKILYEAFATAENFHDVYNQKIALEGIINCTPEQERGKNFIKFLNLTTKINDIYFRNETILYLFKSTPQSEIEKRKVYLINFIKDMNDSNLLIDVFKYFPGNITKKDTNDALEIIQPIENINHKINTIVQMLSFLSNIERTEKLEELNKIIALNDIEYELKHRISMICLYYNNAHLVNFTDEYNFFYSNLPKLNLSKDQYFFWKTMCKKLDLATIDEVGKILRLSSLNKREIAIKIIDFISPQLYELGGSALMAEVANGIIKIGNLW